MKKYFVTYKNPIAATLFLLLLSGIFIYGQLKTSLFPEISFPKIKVIADAGLQPVDRMMATVTKPLENAIRQVPDLVTLQSTTSRGSCEFSAYINWHADVDLARQRIESRIAQITNTLPPGVQVTVEKMNPSILPVMGYSLESSGPFSPIDARMLALYTIKPFLSQVPGVAEIRIAGGKHKEYWIRLNRSRMSALGITPDMISNALAQTNFIRSNGYLADYHLLYLTVTDASVRNIAQLESVVINNNSRRVVRLADVAQVAVQEAVEYARLNANGKESIQVTVIRQPNANLIDVTNAMKKQVQMLGKLLPSGLHLRPYYIQGDFVDAAVTSVTDSVWVGLLLAIAVSVIFLRSLKASAVILFTIPVTLGLTLLGIYFLGYTLNIMTLGAIAAAIGLIIDDAIVVVEQIQRLQEEQPDIPAGPRVQRAIRYLFPAMVGSSLSTIVIFIPFEWMSGVAGAYFSILTNTMILTLLASFFVTWIGLPVIYLLFSRSKPSGKIKQIKAHDPRQQRWIGRLIHQPWLSVLLVAAMIVSTAIVFPKLETGFLPEMDEGSIVLDYSSPPGTSVVETDRILKEVEKLILKVPEVTGYSRRTGTQLGFFITEPNRGDYVIQLSPKRSRSTEEVMADLRQQIESSQPLLRIDLGQVITDMLGDLMTSVQPISIKIFGNDPHQLEALAVRAAAVIQQIKGTADVFDGIVVAGPSVEVTPLYDRLSAVGVTPASLQYQLQNALEGNIVGNIFDRDQVTPIRLIDSAGRNLSVDDIGKLQVFLPSGKLKPIGELATVSVSTGDAEQKRENLQAMGEVTARLDNRDLGSVMKDIRQAMAEKIALPEGYHIEYAGSYADQQQSFRELYFILLAASLLVMAVILFLFRDFRVSLLVMALALLGISGSVLALYLTHTALNVGSYTGIIMIVGIIGENAIFTFLQFRDQRKTNGVDAAVVYAIATRLRPKLMTAIGAIMALLPLALGVGTGAALHRPLAIAVIGGFITALPLLLIVFPSALRLIFSKDGDAGLPQNAPLPSPK